MGRLQPNSRLVNDACASALRASFGASQPGRWAASEPRVSKRPKFLETGGSDEN